MYHELLSQSGFSMDRLASFCAMADAGSIAAVAKGDPSRAALISRQIRELESFFGVELVRRKGRGLELTDAGKELAGIGRHQFMGLADFSARARKSDWVARVVASNSVSQWLLLPRLNQVSAAAPGVRFELHHEQTRDMVTGVREGTFDVAFIRKDALVAGLKKKVLGDVTHSIYIPKRLAKKAPGSVLEALATLPLALPIGGSMRKGIDEIAAKARVPVHVAVACSSYLQAAQLVESSTCAAVLPDTIQSVFEGKPIMRIPIKDSYTLCAVWTGRNTGTRPALAALINCFANVMKI